MNWKKAIGIGVAAVPGLGAAQALSHALTSVADTDEERRAVEVLRPKLAQPTPETADAVAGALALTQRPQRTRSAAGWRPALGWVCAAILLWQYVLRDILGIFVELGPAQGELVTVLLAALGNAALRSHDKKNGLTR